MGNVFKELSRETIKPQTQYFASRLVVELCENIHIHYRNLRLELSDAEFIQFAHKINEALKKLKEYRLEKTIFIRLEDINPYDEGHGKIPDEEHRKGINFAKDLIDRQKKSLLPIVVVPVNNKSYKYQRIDGYKRYMAHLELGLEKIECIVKEKAPLGVQDGMPMTNLYKT